MVATIDEVTHEDVVGVRNVATDTEELEEIEELAVDISDDGAGSRHLVDVGFVSEDFTGFEAEFFHFRLLDGLALEECLKMFLVEISHFYTTKW